MLKSKKRNNINSFGCNNSSTFDISRSKYKLSIGQNGIIQKSKDARREYGQAKANEQEDLSNLSDMIDEATAEPTPKSKCKYKKQEIIVQ